MKKFINFAFLILSIVCAFQADLRAQSQAVAPVAVSPTQENLIFYSTITGSTHSLKMIRQNNSSPNTTHTIAQVSNASILGFKVIKTTINNSPNVTLVYRVADATTDNIVIKRFIGDDPSAGQTITHPLNLLINLGFTPPLESLAIAQDFNNHLYVLVSGVNLLTLLEFDANLNFVNSDIIAPQLPLGTLIISRVKMIIDPLVPHRVHMALHARIGNSSRLEVLSYDTVANSITAQQTVQSALSSYFDRSSFFVDFANTDAVTTFPSLGGTTIARRIQGQWSSFVPIPVAWEEISSTFPMAYSHSFQMLAYFQGSGGNSSMLFLATSNDAGNSLSNTTFVTATPSNVLLYGMSLIEDIADLSFVPKDVLTYTGLPLGSQRYTIHKFISGSYTAVPVATFGSADRISTPIAIPFSR